MLPPIGSQNMILRQQIVGLASSSKLYCRWQTTRSDVVWAPENIAFSYAIRQLIFRPKSGRVFRALFTIAGSEVRVLRIRGAGQDLVQENDWL